MERDGSRAPSFMLRCLDLDLAQRGGAAGPRSMRVNLLTTVKNPVKSTASASRVSMLSSYGGRPMWRNRSLNRGSERSPSRTGSAFK
jgi:hypothetical protein